MLGFQKEYNGKMFDKGDEDAKLDGSSYQR